MPVYKSNAQSVINGFVNQLKGVEENVTKPLIRAIASDVAASNVSRIHNEGKAVDGSVIGDYKSEEYKKKRSNAGRQTQYKDLSFTGKLSKEFQVEAIDDLNIGVGFISEYGSNLSENLEAQTKKKIWGVSEEDEKIAQEEFKNRLNQYLNG